MPKHYVTFGQSHFHEVNEKILDHNTVARFDADDPDSGRAKAFEFFGPKFCFEYHNGEWKEEWMKHYPDGYVDL